MRIIRKSRFQHVTERTLVTWFEFSAHDAADLHVKKQITSDGQDIISPIIYRMKTLSADLLPVTLFESWVTDG